MREQRCECEIYQTCAICTPKIMSEPKQNEIPTPRTNCCENHMAQYGNTNKEDVRYALDFARKLEKQLTEMTSIAERCRTRELEQLKEIEVIQKQLIELRELANTLCGDLECREIEDVVTPSQSVTNYKTFLARHNL